MTPSCLNQLRSTSGATLCALVVCALLFGEAFPADTVRVGAGSYAVTAPPGGAVPQKEIYVTADLRTKVPAADWWSSLAWVPFSEAQYPHPLAVKAERSGLRVYYPGPSIHANRIGIFGAIPPQGRDLVIGHSEQKEFPDARVGGFSDWFVTAVYASGSNRMRISYGHGSPFVFVLYEGGGARITFGSEPVVWSGSPRSAILGVSVGGRHYGLFAPSGSSWSGTDTKTFTNKPDGRRYFSVALLPDRKTATLSLFAKYAHSHVTDTAVKWSYEPRTSSVTTEFRFETKSHEGRTSGTLSALYPHQWENILSARHSLVPGAEFRSIRGAMKLAAGRSFKTRAAFPGVLPSLPYVQAGKGAKLKAYLEREAAQKFPATKDTYWEGKWLGKIASVLPIAGGVGNLDVKERLTEELRRRLESWFRATTDGGKLKRNGLFCYDKRWGTVIGYPASYGTDTQLNDHHFHYGYFLRAAAEVARQDRKWASDERWGGMVKLLIRDISSPDRKDPLFPFLRCFDPYAGHSWASGHAKFADGNNIESSSESMNAWTALILWGEATGDRGIRDLGTWLYTTEMLAIEDYWFDVNERHHHRDYTPAQVVMIWGGKGVNETWFSPRPEHKLGINLLPIGGGSLYLGRYPEFVRRSYEALVADVGDTNWKHWADLIWMFRALDDPQQAIAQSEARSESHAVEPGNSDVNLYHWLYTLDKLGRVDRTVTADYPLFAVFEKDGRKSYVVYNMGSKRRAVLFSDGTRVTVEPGSFVVHQEERRR